MFVILANVFCIPMQGRDVTRAMLSIGVCLEYTGWSKNGCPVLFLG